MTKEYLAQYAKDELSGGDISDEVRREVLGFRKDFDLIKGFLNPEERVSLLEYCKNNVMWYNHLRSSNNETVKIPRRMAYFNKDGNGDYAYANLAFPAQRMTEVILSLKEKVTKEVGSDFNSVLFNYYANGKDQINWHSDKEESLGENPVIACVNLGASRKFWYRAKTPNSEKKFFLLEDGDLLVMGEHCQKNYMHAILQEKAIKTERISLTFRYNYDN